MANPVLVETLALAVPLRIAELRDMHPQRRAGVAQRWAQRGADAVACHGDLLQFRGKARKRHTKECIERGDQHRRDCLTGTADVFNAMAKGLAALSLCPGGATFGGIHWCTDHPGGKRTERPWELGCEHTDGFDGSPVDRALQQRAVETLTPTGGVL